MYIDQREIQDWTWNASTVHWFWFDPRLPSCWVLCNMGQIWNKYRYIYIPIFIPNLYMYTNLWCWRACTQTTAGSPLCCAYDECNTKRGLWGFTIDETECQILWMDFPQTLLPGLPFNACKSTHWCFFTDQRPRHELRFSGCIRVVFWTTDTNSCHTN